MNHLLFAASVGHRMKLGCSLGDALFAAAAVNHEQECDGYERVRYAKYDSRGEVAEEGKTLAEFFESGHDQWISELEKIAELDFTKYLTTDENGDVKFDIERMRADGKTDVLKSIDIYQVGEVTKIKVKSHDKLKARQMLAKFAAIKGR